MATVFALACGIPDQKVIIDRECFQCGHIILGGVELGGWGAFMICRTEACPKEDARRGPVAELDGDEVWLRRFKTDEVK